MQWADFVHGILRLRYFARCARAAVICHTVSLSDRKTAGQNDTRFSRRGFAAPLNDKGGAAPVRRGVTMRLLRSFRGSAAPERISRTRFPWSGSAAPRNDIKEGNDRKNKTAARKRGRLLQYFVNRCGVPEKVSRTGSAGSTPARRAAKPRTSWRRRKAPCAPRASLPWRGFPRQRAFFPLVGWR